MNNQKSKIENRLSKKGINFSTQAINALYSTTMTSSPELVGCSDSLLIGLLNSGSYTIDSLIDAGVDTSLLQKITSNSVIYTVNPDDSIDPVEMLFAPHGVFGQYLNRDIRQEYLETANLLEIAISPGSLGGESFYNFSKKVNITPSSSTSLLEEIEEQALILINKCVEIISRNTKRTLESRKRPLTSPEVADIHCYWLDELTYQEIEWIIHLTNELFVNNRITIEHYEKTLDLADRALGTLGFGSSIFLKSGGDYNLLYTSLKIAKRYAPERDYPILGLIEREGRIMLKYYSYNNSVGLDTDNIGNILSINAEIPLPITTLEVLNEFEDLINSSRVSENRIQQFLEAYPLIIESLGYASCKPQIVLTEYGKKNLIPDFILQKPGNNGFDILDLKLPSARISASSPYIRLSSEISKAIAQLNAYRKYFTSPVNAANFHKKFGLEPLIPELIVVIGRSIEFSSNNDKADIFNQARNNGLRIITYDELIDYGRLRAIRFHQSLQKKIN
ncbi:MAG: DUF4263 domain-containing protein [Vicinamibacterales bacterium]|nr:DUF4263 domain-containing protein [Vicinamibacterales bacterium]